MATLPLPGSRREEGVRGAPEDKEAGASEGVGAGQPVGPHGEEGVRPLPLPLPGRRPEPRDVRHGAPPQSPARRQRHRRPWGMGDNLGGRLATSAWLVVEKDIRGPGEGTHAVGLRRRLPLTGLVTSAGNLFRTTFVT